MDPGRNYQLRKRVYSDWPVRQPASCTRLQDQRCSGRHAPATRRQPNPARTDYYRKYQEIIADYNYEKDRATVEQTFAELVKLAGELDQEQLRHVEEGLSEAELALFDLLRRNDLTQADRERLKQASKQLLARVRDLLGLMPHWTHNAQTQAEVRTSILDALYEALPRPPFTEAETESLADTVYEYVYQRSEAGGIAE